MSIHKNQRLLGMSKRKLIILSLVAAIIIAAGVYALHVLYKPVVSIKNADKEYLYIPTGATFDEVCQLLELKGWLTDEVAFATMAEFMKYKDKVKAGRYEITDGMTARELVRRLRGGQQAPVNVTFNNIRLLPQLAGVVSHDIEADSAELLAAMTDEDAIAELGFNKYTIPAMFIPNTYQFMWNTSGEKWMSRMNTEYKKFWNEERLHKADSIGFTPIEVSIVASIVEEETNLKDEYPIVAGLYLNRLRKGMKLQACPTIKYTIGDFTVRRVIDAYTRIDSPYNTYMYKGLPPGPIRIPSIVCIDAVLNATNHDYLFMCAKTDGPGNTFARTYAEHSRNAKKYQEYLNKRNIYR
ncbi:MAG: endolytic transglycosylase MltG [Bacteroidales bacterium]|nr:endolytic transglycosylase MltG [Bacteroidales bacterium]